MIAQYGSPLQWPGFHSPDAGGIEEDQRADSPSVIISSSGMVTGGRILHHLAQRLPDPRNLVLFIGFQAPGTRGFTIKSKADEVKIFGDSSDSRADRGAGAVQRSRRYAGTAAMAAYFQQPAATTYLVHGEPDASAQLRDMMKKDLGGTCRSRSGWRRWKCEASSMTPRKAHRSFPRRMTGCLGLSLAG